MTKEVWKPIPNTTQYFVSNKSRVKSVKSWRTLIMTPFKSRHKNAYYQVYLSEGGVRTRDYLHRLVAQAFIENLDSKREVNHKNGNKLDNRVENLEWCTRGENMRHAKREGLIPYVTNGKLDVSKAKEIRDKHKTGKFFQRHLAEMYGVSVPTINGIVNNKHWI